MAGNDELPPDDADGLRRSHDGVKNDVGDVLAGFFSEHEDQRAAGVIQQHVQQAFRFIEGRATEDHCECSPVHFLVVELKRLSPSRFNLGPDCRILKTALPEQLTLARILAHDGRIAKDREELTGTCGLQKHPAKCFAVLAAYGKASEGFSFSDQFAEASPPFSPMIIDRDQSPFAGVVEENFVTFSGQETSRFWRHRKEPNRFSRVLEYLQPPIVPVEDNHTAVLGRREGHGHKELSGPLTNATDLPDELSVLVEHANPVISTIKDERITGTRLLYLLRRSQGGAPQKNLRRSSPSDPLRRFLSLTDEGRTEA